MENSPVEDAVKGFMEGAGDVIARFKADPTKVIELEYGLKEKALDLQQKAYEAETDRRRAENEDRTSARERDKALNNKLGLWVQNLSTMLVVIAFIVVVFVVLFKDADINPQTGLLLGTLIGGLGTIMTQAFNFWYGDSQTGKVSNGTLRDLAKTNAPFAGPPKPDGL